MSFTHNGNIVTIDQLSFFALDSTTCHPKSLNVSYMEVVPTPPLVNYVVTGLMFLSRPSNSHGVPYGGILNRFVNPF